MRIESSENSAVSAELKNAESASKMARIMKFAAIRKTSAYRYTTTSLVGDGNRWADGDVSWSAFIDDEGWSHLLISFLCVG